MIYECEQCGSSLPPGVLGCPDCGEAFDEPVPLNAVTRRSGWKKVEENIPSASAATTGGPSPKAESDAGYILPDEKSHISFQQSVHANQHISYWSFSAIGLLLWPVGLIVGIVFLTKSTLLERKLGEHTIVMSVLGLVLGGVLSALMFGTHSALPRISSSSTLATPTAINHANTLEDSEPNRMANTDKAIDTATPIDDAQPENKPMFDFRSRLGFARNDFFAKYIVASEPGKVSGILHLTMKPDFALLSQIKKHDTEYHLWHLWHHMSGQNGDTVYFNDSHNRPIGRMTGGDFSNSN